MDLTKLSRSAFASTGLEICIGGRKMRAVQRVMDRLTHNASATTFFDTPYGTVAIDTSHPPQRLLAYCFESVLSYYRNSPLGQLIVGSEWRSQTFVDVGANLGMYSLLAKSAGADVYMFEPEPAHAKFLIRNEEIFGGPTYPIALSNTVSELPLYYLPNHSGATSLVEAPGYLLSDDVVSVSTFSAQDLGDPARIKLVKIDVEGNEKSTIMGMADFLKSGHRPAIWCEVRGGAASRSANSYREVADYLKQYGYTYSQVSPSVEQRGFERSDFESLTVFDLLFEVPN